MNRTRARFVALWSCSGGTHAEDVCRMLPRSYMEPARHYHTLTHVWRCLRHLDLGRDSVSEPDAVELALWFTRQAGERIRACDRICAMILATTHLGIAAELDTRFVCDIDLAVLGASRNRFREGGRHLRAGRPDLDGRATTFMNGRFFAGYSYARASI